MPRLLLRLDVANASATLAADGVDDPTAEAVAAEAAAGTALVGTGQASADGGGFPPERKALNGAHGTPSAAGGFTSGGFAVDGFGVHELELLRVAAHTARQRIAFYPRRRVRACTQVPCSRQATAE